MLTSFSNRCEWLSTHRRFASVSSSAGVF